MKINNQVSGTAAPSNDPALEIKSGDTLQAVVKEKLPNQEAVIQTRGKELRVQFDGAVPPPGEPVVLTVKQVEGEQLRVKVAEAAKPSTTAPAASQAIRQLSENYSADEIQIVKLLADKGIPVTKEREAVIRAFMRNASGELPQKLETVQAVIQKSLPLTVEHLTAVHEALNGTPISKLLTEIAKAATPQENSSKQDSPSKNGQAALPVQNSQELTAEIAKVVTPQENSSKQALPLTNGQAALPVQNRQELTNALLQLLKPAAEQAGLENLATQKLTDSIAESAEEQQETLSDPAKSPKEQEALNGLRKLLDSKPGLSEIIYRMKEHLPRLDTKEAARWEKTIGEMRRLQLEGSPEQGRALFNQFVEESHTVETTANSTLGLTQDGRTDADLSSDFYSTTAGAAGQADVLAKSMIVTEVTRRLSEAAQEFKNVKRDITRNLNHIIELVKSTSRNVYPQVKAALESTIDKLDKTILKSDITMLTDMSTEKQLLTASSRLADARKQLVLGNNSAAQTILEEVTAKLEQLNWRPADVKIRHMLLRQQTIREDAPTYHKLSAEWESILGNQQRNEASPRQLFDSLRAMGINHESDAARYLADSGNGKQTGSGNGGDEHRHNVKAMLLKLAQEDLGQQNRTVEQALNNLTGQQLLSKQDSGGSMQSLMLSLPLMLSGQPENVKVIVNSRQEGEKVDWENCSLYFALQTRRLGEMGILASVTDRHLSLTLKNDTPGFQQRMEPLAAACKEKLKEIGFSVGHIRFSKLTQEEQEPRVSSDHSPSRLPSGPAVPSKGFDFKI